MNNGFESTKKSFAEQINDIVTATSVSRKEKVQALIKLGIRENEISVILPVTRTIRTRFGFTFGVEIECVMPRQDFENVAGAMGVPYQFERYNHTDNRSYFKFTTDASINTTRGRVGSPIECVSPILDGTKTGFDKLEACCEALNEANAYVNKSTGLHVHIGAQDLTNEQYVNVFVNYQKMQGVISSFLAPSRRNTYYCRPITDYDYNGCYTIESVRAVMAYDRYHSVNPESYRAHGTIEFRQHQGSTNFKKIKNWVNFCAKLVAWSMNNRLENTITSIEDIPFLTATEKRYFESRKASFESHREREVA